MGKGTRKAPPRKRRHNGNKRAADLHAQAIAPTMRRLRAAGIVSQRRLADELNRRHVATARGGKWHRTSVARLLARLGWQAGTTHGYRRDEADLSWAWWSAFTPNAKTEELGHHLRHESDYRLWKQPGTG